MKYNSKLIRKNTLAFLKKLDKYNLPTDQYVIVGSAPLSIRGIRMMSDIDMGVTNKLWQKLTQTHKIIEEGGVRKIRLAEDIEVFNDESFGDPIKGAPTITEQVQEAEVIDGYPFQSLDHMIWFKSNSGREKDLKDVTLIKKWQQSQ